MKKIEKIIQDTSDNNQDKIDWTKVWSKKYPILKEYQSQIDIDYYSAKIRELLESLKVKYGYNDENAMLVLKDILYKEFKSNK